MAEALYNQREHAKEYDELDTLYAYVSFRTQDIREEFEAKVADINNCYCLKYYLCCCLNQLPIEYHWRVSDTQQLRIDVHRATDEPGDIIWENV